MVRAGKDDWKMWADLKDDIINYDNKEDTVHNTDMKQLIVINT
jgi:hypothetical protein